MNGDDILAGDRFYNYGKAVIEGVFRYGSLVFGKRLDV
jgi:hypothetical protein